MPDFATYLPANAVQLSAEIVSIEGALQGVLPLNLTEIPKLRSWVTFELVTLGLRIVLRINPGAGYNADLTYTTNHEPYTHERDHLRVSSQLGGPMPQSGQVIYQIYFNDGVPMLRPTE